MLSKQRHWGSGGGGSVNPSPSLRRDLLILMSAEEAIDVNALISAVRDRPPIWDPAYGINTDPIKSRPLWEEVYRILYPNYEKMDPKKKRDLHYMLQTKWKKLRAEYVQETKRIMSSNNHQRAEATTKFVHYKPLKFLHGVLTHEEYAECFSNLKVHKNIPRRRGTHITDRQFSVAELAYVYFENMVKADKALNSNEGERYVLDDVDRYVWLTFLPFIKKVPEKKKLDLMEKIFDIIQRYAESE